MLTLYYDTILVEINDRIVLLWDTQNITWPKRALLLALEAYKQEVEREREKIQPLF
jgi:hypothetical protein